MSRRVEGMIGKVEGMIRQVEDSVHALAARQHGLVTRAQLLGLGLGSNAVMYRLTTRRLRPVHRGVYQVGPLVSPHAREMAAVLACGPKAVVSHRSAGGLWDLPSRRNASDPVEVILLDGSRRRRPGVHVHRCVGLEPDEVTTFEGIPTTTPARTILDVADVVAPRELERALARAEREGRTSEAELSELLARHPSRPGAQVLRTLLGEAEGPAFTRSEAEARLLELIRKAQIPRPESNVTVEGYEVDFLWRAQRLVVEVDGFAFHSSRDRFESDRKRDARLSARGFRVVRATWRQIVREPEATVARLAQTLAAGALR